MITKAVDQALALVLWAKDASGADDVAVFLGTLRHREGGYFVELQGAAPLRLRDDWLPRIRAATSEIEDIVEGAPFVLSLCVGDAKDATGVLRGTGLRWPSEPA